MCMVARLANTACVTCQRKPLVCVLMLGPDDTIYTTVMHVTLALNTSRSLTQVLHGYCLKGFCMNRYLCIDPHGLKDSHAKRSRDVKIKLGMRAAQGCCRGRVWCAAYRVIVGQMLLEPECSALPRQLQTAGGADTSSGLQCAAHSKSAACHASWCLLFCRPRSMTDAPVHQTHTDDRGDPACQHGQHDTLADGLNVAQLATSCQMMCCCFAIGSCLQKGTSSAVRCLIAGAAGQPLEMHKGQQEGAPDTLL